MYTNRKFVRSKGVKVSINWYQSEALKIIESEDGILGATLLRDMALQPNDSMTKQLAKKFFDLIDEMMQEDRSSAA